MSAETNPTLLSISPSTLSSYVSESTAVSSLTKHTTLNSPAPSSHPPPAPLSLSTGTMADIATGSSNLVPTSLHTHASVTVAESLAISEPLDEPNGDSSFPSGSDAMHASQHSSGSFSAATTDPALTGAPVLALADAALAVVSAAPPVESLTGSRSTHYNNGSHSSLHTDSLQDKQTLFEQRPSSQTKHKRLSILRSTSSTIAPSLTTTTATATAATLASNKEDTKNLPPTPFACLTTSSSDVSSSSFPSSSSLSSSLSPSLPILFINQDTNSRSSPSSLPHQLTNITLGTTATTTTTHSHLLPALAFDLSLSPSSQSLVTENHRTKEDLDPSNPVHSAAATVQTSQEELYNAQALAEQPQVLQRNINHSKIMSASPVSTPMATPNMNGGDHANMFSNNGNNGNGHHLRSPSMSSGTGSGHGQTTTNSTSSSSATTTITTTHSASLNGTSGVSTGMGATTGVATGTTTGLGLGSSSVSDIKLKRFLEHNQRLKEQLEMRRISVSAASQR